jgi:hypothetical protein
MTEHAAIFGNPWHGRLGDGTLKIGTDDPVDTLTIDGVDYPVQTVTGNLGDTRYYRSPDLADPVTPQAVLDIKGEFKRDMILYSDNFRYTPTNDSSILESAYHWLLWDTTAGAWRKMKIVHTWQDLSTNPASPSADGSDLVWIQIYRGEIFGKIDTDKDDTPTGSPSWSLIDEQMLPYNYVFDPLRPPDSYGYKPTSRTLSIDARRDGGAIIIKIEADLWAAPTVSSVHGFPDNTVVYDATEPWLFDVWEVVLEPDGSGVVSTNTMRPTPADDYQNPWDEWWMEITGDIEYELVNEGVEWDTWLFKLPVTMHGSTSRINQLKVGKFLSCAYDKNGVPHLSCIDFATENAFIYDSLYYVNVGGDLVPHGDSPIGYENAFDIPDTVIRIEQQYPPNSAQIFGYYTPDNPSKWILQSSSNSITYAAFLRVIDNENVLFEESPPATGMSWAAASNNVGEIKSGGYSIIRAAPATIDDTALVTPVYASFNPRTGVVVSDTNPVGFV